MDRTVSLDLEMESIFDQSQKLSQFRLFKNGGEKHINLCIGFVVKARFPIVVDPPPRCAR